MAAMDQIYNTGIIYHTISPSHGWKHKYNTGIAYHTIALILGIVIIHRTKVDILLSELILE